jgi:hypothetical protein
MIADSSTGAGEHLNRQCLARVRSLCIQTSRQDLRGMPEERPALLTRSARNPPSISHVRPAFQSSRSDAQTPATVLGIIQIPRCSIERTPDVSSTRTLGPTPHENCVWHKAQFGSECVDSLEHCSQDNLRERKVSASLIGRARFLRNTFGTFVLRPMRCRPGCSVSRLMV